MEIASTIRLVNLKEKILNFDNVLNSNNSLFIKNCSNLNIGVSNKINKIIIENSNKILIIPYQLICGIEISKSDHILINNNQTNSNIIPHISLYKSNLFLIGDSNKYLNIMIESDNSSIFMVEYEYK